MSAKLADQVTGRFEFLAAGGDLRERGPVVLGEVAGRSEAPAGHLLGRRRWRGRGDCGVAAHRPARKGHPLDGQAGQMRDQDGKSLKIARPS